MYLHKLFTNKVNCLLCANTSIKYSRSCLSLHTSMCAHTHGRIIMYLNALLFDKCSLVCCVSMHTWRGKGSKYNTAIGYSTGISYGLLWIKSLMHTLLITVTHAHTLVGDAVTHYSACPAHSIPGPEALTAVDPS